MGQNVDLRQVMSLQQSLSSGCLHRHGDGRPCRGDIIAIWQVTKFDIKAHGTADNKKESILKD